MNEREVVGRFVNDAMSGRDVSGIVFVRMAQTEQLDDVTIDEHAALLNPWVSGVDYAVKALVQYDGAAYRCVQAHKSQADWTPDKASSLWSALVGVGEEYPPWSQPLGAHDAYTQGMKVTHDGKRWICSVASTTYAPGVWGWTEVV